MELYMFTGLGWVLTLSTKTRDAFLIRSGWVLTLGPVILCAVSDHDGCYQVVKLLPKIYYRWLLGHDGYYYFPMIMTRASFLSFPRR
jgi:hypothetical protein